MRYLREPSDLEQVVAALFLGAILGLGYLFVCDHWSEIFNRPPTPVQVRWP